MNLSRCFWSPGHGSFQDCDRDNFMTPEEAKDRGDVQLVARQCCYENESHKND